MSANFKPKQTGAYRPYTLGRNSMASRALLGTALQQSFLIRFLLKKNDCFVCTCVFADLPTPKLNALYRMHI